VLVRVSDFIVYILYLLLTYLLPFLILLFYFNTETMNKSLLTCKYAKTSQPVNSLLLFHNFNELKRETHAIPYNLIHGQLDDSIYWDKSHSVEARTHGFSNADIANKKTHKPRPRTYVYLICKLNTYTCIKYINIMIVKQTYAI